jgi:uncharacterized protein YjiS (DUF1127 family)
MPKRKTDRISLRKVRDWLTDRREHSEPVALLDMSPYQLDDLGLSVGDIAGALGNRDALACFCWGRGRRR